MLLQVFTVFDSKAEAYLPPFYESAIGSAVRSFADTANNPEHSFNKHSSDYTLFHLGSYDDSTAIFEFHEAKIPLGMASEHIINGEQNV